MFSFLPSTSSSSHGLLSASKLCELLTKWNEYPCPCTIQTFQCFQLLSFTPLIMCPVYDQISFTPQISPLICISYEHRYFQRDCTQQCTTVLSDHHSLSRLFSRKTYQTFHLVLNCEPHNSSSYRITWLQKHLMHIQALHTSSSYLQPTCIQQISRKVQVGVVSMQEHRYDLFEKHVVSLNEFTCSWRICLKLKLQGGTPAIQRIHSSSTLYCPQLLKIVSFQKAFHNLLETIKDIVRYSKLAMLVQK